MISEARKALPLLKEQGIVATLVDLYSLPFDDVAILELAQENHGQGLTVEDNYGAGIGSAVADALVLQGGAYMLTQMYVRQIPNQAVPRMRYYALCSSPRLTLCIPRSACQAWSRPSQARLEQVKLL
jgi:transketolase